MLTAQSPSAGGFVLIASLVLGDVIARAHGDQYGMVSSLTAVSSEWQTNTPISLCPRSKRDQVHQMWYLQVRVVAAGIFKTMSVFLGVALEHEAGKIAWEGSC